MTRTEFLKHCATIDFNLMPGSSAIRTKERCECPVAAVANKVLQTNKFRCDYKGAAAALGLPMIDAVEIAHAADLADTVGLRDLRKALLAVCIR